MGPSWDPLGLNLGPFGPILRGPEDVTFSVKVLLPPRDAPRAPRESICGKMLDTAGISKWSSRVGPVRIFAFLGFWLARRYWMQLLD